MDTWTELLDSGSSVHVIYMDFQKAFDSVPHRRLILKLEAHGIKQQVLQWITAFLSNRKQQVVLKDTHSQEADVTSGIPQGSVLGPALFVLYINDLPENITNKVKMFADDTKLYGKSDTAEDTNSIQEDLTKLQEWSEKWLLNFHPQKCTVVKLGKDKSDASYQMKNPSTDGTCTLEESENQKDLGVTIDNRLSFKEHTAQTISKANRMVGIIRRSFDHLTEETFAQLFKSIVRPILEYGHTTWQPHQKTLCSEVENVQRRATKLLAPLREKPYSERLAALKMPSLEHRRKRGDMIEIYKYLHHYYDVEQPNLSLATTTDIRGNSLKLEKKRCKLNVRAGYFSYRATSNWNSLPDPVVTAPTLNSFKSRLDHHWKDLPKIYNPECQE
ncbi:Uncharacterised protein r2_g1733 [Pycnogonum litorale]